VKFTKKRGVSPVIAAILLIGVTILAGVIVTSTVLLVMNTEEPISIIISKPENYASTEDDIAFYDPLVDSMIIPITNDMREPLIMDTRQVYIYNASDDEILDRWYVSVDDDFIPFQGQESLFLNLKTEGKFDTQELSPGDQFYVTIPVRKSEGTDFVTFTSNTFSVTTSNTNPLYALVPQNNAFQDGTEVKFDATLDQENESRELTFAIFNYGNADQEKPFSVTIHDLENETLFSTDEYFLLLTVPNQGPTNNDTVCDLGEACVVGSFNITKWANNRSKDSFYVYISAGSETIKFNLNFVSFEDQFLTMPNLRRNPNNQWGEIIQFNAPQYWREQTLDLAITAWNNGTSGPATLEILNLNTTAFTLNSPSSQQININPGNLLTTIPDQNDHCGRGQMRFASCDDFTWSITRNIIQERGFNNPTVYYTVMLPYYEFQIRWVEVGLVKTYRIQVNPPFRIPI
jgi:flagellin-like protein